MFSYQFMQNAWLAGTAIAVASAIIGVFVVARGMSFYTHTLSEISFSGASLSLFMHWPMLAGMLLTTLLSTVMISKMSLINDESETAVSAVSSFIISLGILFLYLGRQNSSSINAILFGSIFTITTNETISSLLLALLVILIVLLIYRPLKRFAFDYDAAKFSLNHLQLLNMIFMVLVAVTVTMATQIVGSLLIFILIIIPAATVMKWGGSIIQLIWRAIAIAVSSVWLSLVLAYYTNLPVNFLVSSLIVLAFLLSSFYKSKFATRQ